MKKIKELLIKDIKLMSLKQHLWYWIIPFVVLGISIVFYFSEVPLLVHIICPPVNHEWGFVENLQLLIIFITFVLSVYAIIKKNNFIQRIGFGFIAIFSLFVLLEEMDYGVHIVQLIEGVKHSYLRETTGFYNLHNKTDAAASWFKRPVYGLMLLLFVLAPFFKENFKNKIVLYLIPRARIFLTAVLCVIIDLIPRLIVGLNILPDGGFDRNIAEFSEAMVYYVFLIYVIELIFVNKWEFKTNS